MCIRCKTDVDKKAEMTSSTKLDTGGNSSHYYVHYNYVVCVFVAVLLLSGAAAGDEVEPACSQG